jgi:hypothetical protein
MSAIQNDFFLLDAYALILEAIMLLLKPKNQFKGMDTSAMGFMNS